MKRLLPAPLLSALLFAFWLVLNESLAVGQLLLGGALALAAPVLTRGLRPSRVRVRRPGAMLRLAGRVLSEVIRSNFEVALGALRLPEAASSGGFVRVPLDMRDPNGLAVLAVIMCAIPGTIWCELSPDRSALLIHVFHLRDEAAMIDHVKTRYERLLMEIFE